MKTKYTAKIYLDQSTISHKEGDNVDDLYNWMLIETQDKFGSYHGEIIDNKTKKTIKCFRKAPVE